MTDREGRRGTGLRGARTWMKHGKGIWMSSTVWMKKDGRDPARYFFMRGVFKALLEMLEELYHDMYWDSRKAPVKQRTIDGLSLVMSIWPESDGHGDTCQVLHAYIGRQEFRLEERSLYLLYTKAKEELE